VKPILLFDDIFDKLDESRVAKIIGNGQQRYFGRLLISDTHQERTEAIVKSTSIHKILLMVFAFYDDLKRAYTDNLPNLAYSISKK
jgi:hypothetical protein